MAARARERPRAHRAARQDRARARPRRDRHRGRAPRARAGSRGAGDAPEGQRAAAIRRPPRHAGADDALAARADVVFNCLPLTPATEKLCDAAFFAAMQTGAYFINVGRGKTVDTAALLQALKSGRLGGAGLDVTEPEPLPADHELWRLPNVVITPHDSARSDRAEQRRSMLYRENLRRFVQGEALLSVVDKASGY
ncbi:MAG: NAD(P)-dependent oxidoreductase [Planctomycetota bacterium]